VVPNFEVQGYGRDTNRKRKHTYSARNEEEAILLASHDGTIVETVIRIPEPGPELATERQVSYATSLGLVFPSDITLTEMSHLISRRVDEDEEAPAWLREYAAVLGLPVTAYVGKRALYDWVHIHLKEYGPKTELGRWFLLHVWKEMHGQLWDDPFQSGLAPELLESMTNQLITDESTLKSIRRYEGRDLIDLGENVDDDGWVARGGSKASIGYKAAYALLKPYAQPRASRKRTVEKSGFESGGGCLSSVLAVIVVTFGLWAAAL